jgi:predicted phage-related endonuclease
MQDNFEKLGDIASGIVAAIKPTESPRGPSERAGMSVPAGVNSHMIYSREQWLSDRKHDVTASVSAALFGEHPYMTPYRLWAIHKGLEIVDQADNKLFKRGRLLEPVILELLREEFPTWTIEPCRTYYREVASRLGATPDFIATRPDMPGFGVIEGKSVGKFAFKKGWRGMDGDMSIPLWIGVQVSQTAMLAGASWAMIAAMEIGDGGLEMHTEEVEINPALMTKLRGLAKDFWRRVEENDPYEPDFGKDAELIGRLYEGENGGLLELGADKEVSKLLDRREALKVREADGAKAAKERKGDVDSKLIHRLGNARAAVLADGRAYTCKIVRKGAYQVGPQQYPQLTVGTV